MERGIEGTRGMGRYDGGKRYRERQMEWAEALGMSFGNLVQWKYPQLYESNPNKDF